MTIILGVFGHSFDQLCNECNAITWDSNGWLCNYTFHKNNPFAHDFYNSICHNLDACTSCVFDVTHLKLPFNDRVITLHELHIVIHNEEYFNKTTFFVNSKEINKEQLKQLFLINEPIEFKDYAELFIL